MIGFIKDLEKKFEVQIEHSNKHIKYGNYYTLDSAGNIKTLHLDEVNIKDLKLLLPIAPSLTGLAVCHANIKALSPLKDFTNLERLDVSYNRLPANTIGQLGYLKKLKRLGLRSTNLKDTSPLGTLTNLEFLDVGGQDRLFEIKGLEQLKKLHTLDLGYTKIESIKKIHVADSLRDLNIEQTLIENLIGIDRFPYLEEFGLPAMELIKLEGFEPLKQLKYLDLSSNEFSKIEGLSALQSLEKLCFYGNDITKVENLEGLTNLKFLCLRRNKIIDFDASCLSGITSECTISVAKNPITNISQIKGEIPKNITLEFEEGSDKEWFYEEKEVFG